jgi:hypothetical protein
MVGWTRQEFVDMPVQVGALTSPQSMLAPLAVQVNEVK